MLGRAAQDAGKVELTRNLSHQQRARKVEERALAHGRFEMRVLPVDEIADFLENHASIAVANWMKSVVDELAEQFGRVGEVEVSRNGQRARLAVGAAKVWVAHRAGIAAVGAVTKVAEKDLAEKGKLALERSFAERTHFGFAEFGGG